MEKQPPSVEINAAKAAVNALDATLNFVADKGGAALAGGAKVGGEVLKNLRDTAGSAVLSGAEAAANAATLGLSSAAIKAKETIAPTYEAPFVKGAAFLIRLGAEALLPTSTSMWQYEDATYDSGTRNYGADRVTNLKVNVLHKPHLAGRIVSGIADAGILAATAATGAFAGPGEALMVNRMLALPARWAANAAGLGLKGVSFDNPVQMPTKL